MCENTRNWNHRKKVRSDSFGTVQYLHDNRWRLLCAKHDFSRNDANAICRSLGQMSANNFSLVAVVITNDTLWSDSVRATDECPTNTTIRVFCDAFTCGQRNATDEDIPAPLLLRDADGHNCSAQALSSQWLLTSAKCVSHLTPNTTRVNGSEIARVITHFRYSNFRSLRFPEYDFALVQTKHVLDARVVCLPSHPIDAAITCFVGTSRAYEVVESHVCNATKHFNGSITSRHVCAQSQSTSSSLLSLCSPIGSPLLCLSLESVWYLAGLLSYEYTCTTRRRHSNRKHFHIRHPSVFANVFSIRDFVELALNSRLYLTKSEHNLYEMNTNFTQT